MILVTGSTGRIGRDVVFGLVLKDIQLRVMLYGGAGNEWLHWSNVETVMGDYAKPETLDAALDGIETAFLISGPSPRQVELQNGFVDACVRHGIKHVVKVSAYGADANSACRFLRWHAATETHLSASGMRVTNLRPTLFFANILDQRAAIAGGTALAGSLNPATRISMVDTRDVADVAVKKLLESSGESENIDITGPAAVTQPEVAAALSRVLGRTIAYAPVAPADYFEGLRAARVPVEVAEGVLELNALYDAGHGAAVGDAVERIAGHPATSVEAYITRVKQKLAEPKNT
ncbi:MAG: NmrA family NAD(P)-binding protein [Candidatus Velthaea sp.]